MLNPIFWKKVQGQKHPWRWGIVEHQIPSIKVLFTTNVNSHTHPGVKFLSSESKTQLVKQRKQNSYRRAYIYIYILTHSFWTGTKVIRKKHIIQPTGFGACISSCCQWDGDVPAPWERSNSHPPIRVEKLVYVGLMAQCSKPVSMEVADSLAHTWRYHICNHHYDLNRSVHLMGQLLYDSG